MNNTVSYDLDIRQGLRAVGTCFRQGLNRAVHRRRIVGHVDRAALRRRFLGGAQGQQRAMPIAAGPIEGPGHQQRAGRIGKETELQAAGTGIENQDAHGGER